MNPRIYVARLAIARLEGGGCPVPLLIGKAEPGEVPAEQTTMLPGEEVRPPTGEMPRAGAPALSSASRWRPPVMRDHLDDWGC